MKNSDRAAAFRRTRRALDAVNALAQVQEQSAFATGGRTADFWRQSQKCPDLRGLLGATPKHPPGFDNPTPAPIPASEQADLKALESSVPAASMAVKITSNRWTPDKALIATGTLTNTSAVPVTVTKMVATGFDGNQNLVAVAHGLPGDGSFTIANAEIAPGATVIFKVALSDEKKSSVS